MKPNLLFVCLALVPLLYTNAALSHGKLDAAQLDERFSDTTQICRKERDQSTCTTYFSADGVIKRRLHASDKRREGTWEADLEHDQLCITWKGRTRALCFDAYENKDGTIDMYKSGKHLSTVLHFLPGNAERL